MAVLVAVVEDLDLVAAAQVEAGVGPGRHLVFIADDEVLVLAGRIDVRPVRVGGEDIAEDSALDAPGFIAVRTAIGPTVHALAVEQELESLRLFLRGQDVGVVLGCPAAGLQPERPTNAAEDVLLVGLAAPDVFTVPEGGVEDLALADVLAPGDGIITRDEGVGVFVEGQETVDFLPLEVGELVDLVKDGVDRAQILGGRVGGIQIVGIDLDLGTVGLELAAERLDVGGIPVEGVTAGVHADQGVAAFDPADEAVLVGDGQVAGGVGEDHRVHVLQLIQGQLFGHFGVVGALGSAPDDVNDREIAAGLTQGGEDVFGGLNRAVAESLGGGDDDHPLGGGVELDGNEGGHQQAGGQETEFHAMRAIRRLRAVRSANGRLESGTHSFDDAWGPRASPIDRYPAGRWRHEMVACEGRCGVGQWAGRRMQRQSQSHPAGPAEP